ncbi:MAG: sulfur transferase domain-containing protein [Planctomycetota bacterium]
MTTKLNTVLGVVLVGIVGAAGCSSAPKAAERPAPPRISDWEDFSPESESERAFIGGQPSVEALREFKASGGMIVVNLRTDDEMARLPYYASVVEAEGLEYVHVPTRGSEMGTSQYEVVRDAIDSADGPVLLHCGSGGRAMYMWAGHMTQSDGKSPDEAKAWCSAQREEPWEGGELAIDRIVSGE